jgi:hypothetical protein
MTAMDQWARYMELSTASLSDVIENRVAAVRIPDFATAEECQTFAAALNEAPLQYYKVGRPAAYLGMTFIQYMNRPKRDYFDEAPEAFSAVEHVTSRSFDPLKRFIDLIHNRTSYSVAVAQEPGHGSYFAGIVRILSGGNDIHIDFAPKFAVDHAVGRVDAQLTWNLYIDEPETGGETIIWNKPWMPTGNKEEDAKYIPYTADELSDAQTFTFKPRIGNVVIFNSRNPHQVQIAMAERRLHRIGMGSFVGRAGARDLVLWS